MCPMLVHLHVPHKKFATVEINIQMNLHVIMIATHYLLKFSRSTATDYANNDETNILCWIILFPGLSFAVYIGGHEIYIHPLLLCSLALAYICATKHNVYVSILSISYTSSGKSLKSGRVAQHHS